MFNFVHKKYAKDTVNLELVFSDKVTCEFCQDVVRRIRKAEKSNNKPKTKKYLDLSYGIFADFDLGNVDGKPLYGPLLPEGKSEQIDGNKYQRIIEILLTLP